MIIDRIRSDASRGAFSHASAATLYRRVSEARDVANMGIGGIVDSILRKRKEA